MFLFLVFAALIDWYLLLILISKCLNKWAFICFVWLRSVGSTQYLSKAPVILWTLPPLHLKWLHNKWLYGSKMARKLTLEKLSVLGFVFIFLSVVFPSPLSLFSLPLSPPGCGDCLESKPSVELSHVPAPPAARVQGDCRGRGEFNMTNSHRNNDAIGRTPDWPNEKPTNFILLYTYCFVFNLSFWSMCSGILQPFRKLWV